MPCRFVTIADASFTGSSCIVRLHAGSFVDGLNDTGFRTLLTDSERALLPNWETKPGVGPVLNGRFFFSIDADLKTNATNDDTAFERTAIALVAHKDFSDPQSTVFYNVRGVALANQPAGARKSTPQAQGGWYQLRTGVEYQLEVYSFVPPKVELKSSKLHVDSDVKEVEFPLGNHRDIDSRYDMKRFSFRVSEQIQNVSAGIRLSLSGPEDQNRAHSDIMISIKFRGSLRMAVIRVLFVGIGTAGPGIVATYVAEKLTWGIGLVMLILGLVAAVGTVFTWVKKI